MAANKNAVQAQAQQHAEIERILRSMGVDKFDPLVVSALQEYANRFASELVCDAKDYAAHAGHADVEIADAKAAVSLSSTYFLGPDPREKEALEKKQKVNKEGLASLVDAKIWTRYPGVTDKALDPSKALLQRSYTLVPSNQAQQSSLKDGPSAIGNEDGDFAPMQMDA